ncbi:hypothetical protein WBP07_31140 [Novosphingobium sp. BL-8A]|uniref:hypothetical protein n=1 Tax=Novosphingobium sp. BL-8A TaxID=3127639 RepID=UPI0037570512
MNEARNTVVELSAFSSKRAQSESAPAEPDGKTARQDRKPYALPTALPLRMRAWADGTRLFPGVIAVGAVVFGLTALKAPEAAMPAAASIGALFVLNKRIKLALAAAILAAALLWNQGAYPAIPCWFILGLTIAAIVTPRRLVPALFHPPRWTWVLMLALTIACHAAAFLVPEGKAAIFAIIGMPFTAYLGCGLARHLAMGDARLLTWGEHGLVPVTRDLLLGRITSGMLHDLAQPLNVISMANGNLAYIVEQLDIDARKKADLTDRIARIGTHTESAAYILGLFRGFGRDGNREPGTLNVRSALERAVAATKSNVRHHGVSVELAGDGLEHLLPAHHGALEMMAVAALLNAFAAYIGPDGERSKGLVRLVARLSPAFLTVSVQCLDEDGAVVGGPMLDHATLWLVEHVALAVSGDFRCHHRDRNGTRFLIRLGRDDI